MLRGWPRGLGMGVLAACLAGCTNEGPLWELDEIQSLDDLAEQFPGAAPLLAEAKPLRGADLRDALRVRHVPEEPALDPRWRSLARELVVDVSPEDKSSFEVSVPGTPYRVGVHRSAPLASRANQLPRALHVHAPGGAAEAFFFATAGGIEELLLVRDVLEPVEYELDLPRGWQARRAKGRAPIVEMVDGLGAVRLRVVADRAWDSTDQRATPTLEVDQASFRIGLPETSVPPVLFEPEWQYGGDLEHEHRSGTATLLPDGKVLIAGGADAESSAAAELFDPATGTVEQVRSLREPRGYHTATLLRNGMVLFVGGNDPQGARLASAELYDPALQEFESTGGLAEARWFHTATLLDDGQVLVVGGSIFEDTTAEVYHPGSDEFSQTTGAPEHARTLHTATRLPNGDVLIVGGTVAVPGSDPEEPPDTEPTDTAEIYHWENDDFEPTGALREARKSHVALLLSEDGPVLVADGLVGPYSDFPTNPLESYDLAAEQFTVLPHGDHSSQGPAAASLMPDGTVLLSGSQDYSVLDPGHPEIGEDHELPAQFSSPVQVLLPQGRVLLTGAEGNLQLYDPAEPAIVEPSPITMLGGGGARRAAVLPTGDVLVVGDRYGGMNSQVFDPRTGTFRFPTGLPREYRFDPSVTVLRDGSVLVAGGGHPPPTGVVKDSIDVFDPQIDSFDEVGRLHHRRYDHTGTLLPDGRVLVVGGDDSSGPGNTEVAEIEIFDPITGTSEVVGRLAEPRMGHAAALLLTGKVLIAGGCGQLCPTEWNEIFDPATGETERLSAELLPREGPRATVLADGRVFLSGDLEIYEIFDPSDPLHVVTGAMTCRNNAGAALLPSGKVLVAGGHASDSSQAKHTPELYDPISGELHAAGVTTDPHIHPAVALLPDGTVLLAGGDDDDDSPMTSAEIWREAAIEESFRPTVESVGPIGHSPPPTVVAGSTTTIRGAGFTGVSEASGGPSPSPADHPVVTWMPFGGMPTTGTAVGWTDETIEWKVPLTSYPGPGLLFVAVNGVRSIGKFVTVLPAPQGTPCTYDPQCESGHCAGGICCQSACEATCMSCRAVYNTLGQDGVCSPVIAGMPRKGCDKKEVELCSFNGACDGAGECATYAEGTPCGTRRICISGECLPGCNSHLDCGEGWACMADGTCGRDFDDDEIACAPACAVGAQRRGTSEMLALLLLGGLWRVRRRRAVA